MISSYQNSSDLNLSELIFNEGAIETDIRELAFSPDGTMLASASQILQIWNTQTYQCIKKIQPKQFICQTSCLSFSIDGKQLAAGSGSQIHVLNTQNWNEIGYLDDHKEQVKSVVYSPNGKFIISGSNDEKIKVWDSQSFKLISTLEGEIFRDIRKEVNSISCSPNNIEVAGAYRNKMIQIWEIQTEKCLYTLEDHKSIVKSVSYSPDGNFLASGSNDKTIKIWDVASKYQCLATLEGHERSVQQVTYLSSNQLLSVSDDKTVKVWDVASYTCIKTMSDHTNFLLCLASSLNCEKIASAGEDNKINIWNAKSFLLEFSIQGEKENISAIALSPDSKLIATGGTETNLKVWERKGNKIIADFDSKFVDFNSICFSLDGKKIFHQHYHLKIWDIEQNKLTKEFINNHASKKSSFQQLPYHGNSIISADESMAKFYNLEKEKITKIKFRGQSMTNIDAVSEDSKFVASSKNDRIYIYFIVNQRYLKHYCTLRWTYGFVQNISFVDDLLIASIQGEIYIWDWRRGRMIGKRLSPFQNIFAVSKLQQKCMVGFEEYGKNLLFQKIQSLFPIKSYEMKGVQNVTQIKIQGGILLCLFSNNKFFSCNIRDAIN